MPTAKPGIKELKSPTLEATPPSNATQKPEAESKPKPKTAPKPEPGEVKLTNMMYLGPSLADGSLRRGQTFIRGIPERFENEAQIKQLFVPASELPRIKKQLRDPKSWISRRIANFVDPTMGGNK